MASTSRPRDRKTFPLPRPEPFIALALLLLVWELACGLGGVPAYFLPAPSAIAAAFPKLFPGVLVHLGATLYEALAGFLVAAATGLLTAFLLHRFRMFDRAVRPLLVVSQTIPLIALAPLFALWFGFGSLPKVLVVVMTCYFPIAVSAAEAFASVDRDYGSLLLSMGSGTLGVYRHAIIPGAAPGIVAGLKIAAAYSVSGAVVAEWLGGSKGLGLYMLTLKKGFALDRLFGVVVIIVASSLLLWGLVSLSGSLLFPWKRSGTTRAGK